MGELGEVFPLIISPKLSPWGEGGKCPISTCQVDSAGSGQQSMPEIWKYNPREKYVLLEWGVWLALPLDWWGMWGMGGYFPPNPIPHALWVPPLEVEADTTVES